MSKQNSFVLSAVIFILGLSTGLVLANRRSQDGPQTKTLLDNQRVTVTEVTLAPGARRPPYTRPTDQIIIFIDEANYDAIDAAGQKQTRRRAAGEVIWHNKGEAAPLLVNVGRKSYRNLVVALK
jgi:hypothetical protein